MAHFRQRGFLWVHWAEGEAAKPLSLLLLTPPLAPFIERADLFGCR